MAKVIIREIIISLLICLAVILGLSALFYKFIPNNKIVPERVTYKVSDDVKEEIGTDVQDTEDLIIKTYEITASDLEGYEKTEQYKPGKANPFAPVSIEDETNGEGGNSSSGGNITGESVGGNSTGNSGSNNSNKGGGSLFETGNSK